MKEIMKEYRKWKIIIMAIINNEMYESVIIMK